MATTEMRWADRTKTVIPPVNGERRSISGKEWWLRDEESVSEAITATLEKWSKSTQLSRIRGYHQQARLYGSVPIDGGFYGGSLSRYRAFRREYFKTFLNLNVTQSCLDTLKSKIAKSNPEPFWITVGGDHNLQRRAKARTKFDAGVRAEEHTTEKAVDCLFWGLLWGDGFLWIRPDQARLRHQMVRPIDVWTDDVANSYMSPTQMIVLEYMARDKAFLLYPDHEEIIKTAKLQDVGEQREAETIEDLITIRHAWHLPARASRGAKPKDGEDTATHDGRYTVSCTDGVLSDCEYDHDRVPLAHLQFEPRPLSNFYGQGLVEQLESIQTELMTLLAHIQFTMNTIGFSRILLPIGSGVSIDHLDSDAPTGTILEYIPPFKPEWMAPLMVQPQVYAQVDRLFQRAYSISGISELSATAEKPAGLKSGEALREYSDISTERFLNLGQKWEQFHLDIAELNIMVLRDMLMEYKADEREGKPAKFPYSVRSPTKSRIDIVNVEDLALDEPDDIFYLRCQKVSSIANEIAGKEETVVELMQAGKLPDPIGFKLLGFPDWEREEGLMSAEQESIERTLDEIVDEGATHVPEPWNTIPLCQSIAARYYWNGHNNGLEEGRMEKLRDYLRACMRMQIAKAPPAPPPAPLASPPLAQHSDLLKPVPHPAGAP